MTAHGVLDAVGPCGGRRVAEPARKILLFLPGAGQQPSDFLPFKDDDGENRAQLDGDFRVGGDVASETKGMADQDQGVPWTRRAEIP